MIFIGPFLYGLLGMMHGPPPLFNSFLQAFFFDPFIHQGRILEYANYIHFYNNIVVCSLTCLCYGLFCANFQRKFKHYFKDKKSKKNAHVFIQASIICCVNLIAAIIYVVMQNFTLPPIFVHIAQLSFQLVHSCPPYIYIAFNKAVRHKILSLFGVQMARTGQVTSGVYVNNKIGVSSTNVFPAKVPASSTQGSGNQAESIII
ncbi:hypothetical protein WR25_00676 isoform D [Diploscapter pachys]|nr:hypothetical protein WR25_00676 isoform B [Diploscapter pachys]PAV61658.1 hypothetical protein WR25_00676 isoform D [Diploscapter pachys]